MKPKPTVSVALEAFAEHAPNAREWVVAYSGGVDSTVLLHAAMLQARRHDTPLRVVHVNHQMQAAASEFERHCKTLCNTWGLNLDCHTRPVDPGRGESPEAQARDVRYRCFEDYVKAGAVLLLAHHQEDQAETVLLQLLRGGGVAGCAGMPQTRDWEAGQLARPLLEVSRAEIEAYAAHHALPFLEDPSNLDRRYDRNFLRHEVWPLLQERWPSVAVTLSRAARNQAHAARLLRECAQEDLARSQDMSVAYFETVSEDRGINLLRFWIARHGYQVPGERRLKHCLHVIRTAAADRVLTESFETYELHRWRGRLYLSPRLPEIPREPCWSWKRGENLTLPELGLQLRWRDLEAQMNPLPELPLHVRLRTGGEACRLAGRTHHHKLKKLLQQAGVPPWLRGRIPLIYQGTQLRLVWNHFECAAASP